MPNQISEQIKSVRLQRLDTQLNENQREFNMSCIGREMVCLCEGDDKTGKHLVFRTPYMQQCIVEKPNYKITPLQKIKITDANKASLRGEIIK
jgi:tRNA-2-methylthio-N6-dimethylallyladenosine synthase